MKANVYLLLCISLIATACLNNQTAKEESNQPIAFHEEIVSDHYELHQFSKQAEAVLVLFGGAPEKPKDVQREFKILELIKKHKLAVVYINFNMRLWLEDYEILYLDSLIENIFNQHRLPKNNIYLGGYSSGGNVSLLLSNHFIKHQSALAPKGVFIIDSPIDLVALYNSAEKNISRQFSDVSVQESQWIIQTLGQRFGHPDEQLENYEQYAVYTSKTNNITQVEAIKEMKIRLYTEPDSLWWNTNRMADVDQMNAYYLEKLYKALINNGFEQIELIKTENKGYRANGNRHPHSWSIVDKTDLIEWMLE